MDYGKCNHCNKKMLSGESGICTEVKGKQIHLCGPCWNKIVSEDMGFDFKTIELKPITLRDCKRKPHEFHFFTHMISPWLSIKAYEVINGKREGYEFSVSASHDCDQSNLILDLYEKMKRGLSKKYLKKYDIGTGIKDKCVVGRVEWDDDYGGEIPKLCIDGEQVTWNEFGKMLMSFEGWQFKLDMIDPSDEA